MKTTELFGLVNGQDENLTKKYMGFMSKTVNSETKHVMHVHSHAFDEFVQKAVTAFLENNPNHKYTQEKLFAQLNADPALQEEYKAFVQSYFSKEELNTFQEHAMAMNEIVLQSVKDFAKAENIQLED